ncbi:transmembrane protein 120A-A-like isoform X3 [Branchiostoma floridae x Branchiostoma japonicum]
MDVLDSLDTDHSFSSHLEEWDSMTEEYKQLEEEHKAYKQKVEELKNLQNKLGTSIKKQRKDLLQLSEKLQGCDVPAEYRSRMSDITEKMKERSEVFREIEAFLPKDNGIFLNTTLGRINVTMFSKSAKVGDAIFHFLLVWYYCTLTLRESILIVNGSRIKGWWVAHHYISTYLTGVGLTWPDSITYHLFRDQYMDFSIYLSFVQILQYYYQSGCLYRLRALGERHNMDITVEGFQTWMWRGLKFLLPFVYLGHFFQLYNAYTLYQLSLLPECEEWQVLMMSATFFVLFLGNSISTWGTVANKLGDKSHEQRLRRQSLYQLEKCKKPDSAGLHHHRD